MSFEINYKEYWLYDVTPTAYNFITKNISCRTIEECLKDLITVLKTFGEDVEESIDVIQKEDPSTIVYVYRY